MSQKKNNAPKAEAPKAEAPKAGGLVLQRKITLKPLQKMPMEAKARIAGRVTKTETVTTNYGDSTRFVGDIAMRISESGKFNGDEITMRAGAAFLPKAAEGVISGALAAKMGDENFTGLEFAFEIGKVESEASRTGYEWEVRSLIAPEPAKDPVLLLLA